MALDESLLANLMFVSSGLTGPQSLPQWKAVAKGVVNGLKAGSATITATGIGGSPGQASCIGALHGGIPTMLPLVVANMVGVIPPAVGAPTPIQQLYYLAVSQIATHTLTNLEVKGSAAATATGIATILPGGFVISGAMIGTLIKAEFLSIGLLTPTYALVADAIGSATEQVMTLATSIGTVVGGAPAGSPPPPTNEPIIGVIS